MCCARRMRMRASSRSTRTRARAVPGVLPGPDRQRSRPAGARPAAALASAQAPRRLAGFHLAAAAARARARALCRRPGRADRGRDDRTGQGRGRAIEIEYETLPAVPTTEAAVAPGAPAVWQDCPDNMRSCTSSATRPRSRRRSRRPTHVVRHRLVISRLTTNSMEPRGCLAEYDAREDRTTLRCTVQVPHLMRRTIAEEIFQVPETQVPHHCRQCRRRLWHEGRALSRIFAHRAGRPAAPADR